MFEKGNRANTLHGILLIALFSFAAFYLADLPINEAALAQSAHHRNHPWYALCQQPSQQTARNLGAGY